MTNPILCAWCRTYDNVITPLGGSTLEECEVAIIHGDPVSHGMCEQHEAVYRQRYNLPKGLPDDGA